MAPTVTAAVLQDTEDFVAQSNLLLNQGDIFNLVNPVRFAKFVWDIMYIFVQAIIIAIFKPPPPKSPDGPKNPHGRIAVIGAGLTGVSSAAHAIAHNFDVVIYEAGPRSSLGGIWAHVNKTSGLQLNSLLYRFHPAVLWSRAFPLRDEIVGEIEKVWKEYHLEPRTRFDTPVTSVKRAPPSDSYSKDPDRSRWIINGGEDGPFDAVIVTVGTCGKPHWIGLPGIPKDAGKREVKGKEKQPDGRRKKRDESNGPTQDTTHNHEHEDGSESNDDKDDSDSHDNQDDNHSEEQDHNHENDHTETSNGHGNGGHKPKRRRNKNKRNRRQDQHPHQRHEQNGNGKHGSDSRFQQDSGSNNEEAFAKTIIHSSELDSPSFQLKGGERVVVIGSGASGVEAVETILDRFGSAVDEQDNARRSAWREAKSMAKAGAKAGADADAGKQNGEKKDREDEKGVEIYMISRTDKWVIPRNIVIDTFLAAQPFGRQMPLSFLWEWFLKKWQYRGVENLVPQETGIFEGTPVVNDVFLPHVRSGRCNYIRGEPVRLTKDGVLVKPRKESAKKVSGSAARGAVHDVEKEELIKADIIVLATGFEKPNIDFLEKDLFPEGYQRPDLYLQNFSTEDWSILMTNSSYMNAIGTVGHFHIGIYTRILLTLLMDPSARPSPKDMKLWVDVLRFLKRGATRGALGFFTYMELTIWLLGFHLLRPDRIRWLFFIMNGWGVHT